MATKIFSSEFGKTFGAGISALAKGKKDYYILEHLVGSHYHSAGEKQEILLDEVILGRENDCHVRFDEKFVTVSRHHASIVREGDNWRLIQLSKTNTTFLNGKAIQDSWYLQSGDEIQLAVNGPKLIFRVPTDKSGLSFTQRLDSFRDQVIRPYQTAFIVAICVIVMIIAGCVIGGIIIKKQRDMLAEQRDQITSLCDQLSQTNEQLANTIVLADSAQQAAFKAESDAIKAETEALNAKAKASKSQKDLVDVQNQMQQLQEKMNSFYDGFMKGANPEIERSENNEYLPD